MPVIIDEVVTEITPPAPTSSANENASASAPNRVDPASVLREVQRLAERAERLRAD